MTPHPIWDQSLTLAPHTAAEVRIGPLTLTLERRPHEWRLRTLRDEDPLAGGVAVSHLPTEHAVLDDASTLRFPHRDAPPTLLLKPKLADRAMIVRPLSALRLAAGAWVDVFVSTPIWIQAVFEAGETELFDMPVVRPSDTWFGGSTIEGELAYVSHTAARLDEALLPVRPSRAITRLRVRNTASTRVALERIYLPAPALALYRDGADALRTQPVEVTLSTEGPASVTPLSAADDGLDPARLIAAPRQAGTRHILLRALSSLWS